ncbi:hypothetical protein [Bradyrhizobium sp. CB2312]|uniref:hypothetical protein n=1 Tax=Bradyrhizobium sp. CB2312 TaxID=3039155 RepID=UPI0024B11789|nr:hypothetical protein [Bradyrhizobium sp. CB2312]WFU71103.1 hypothetical protein QA642_38530 [Bradyrhizobium sp. CB2312]
MTKTPRPQIGEHPELDQDIVERNRSATSSRLTLSTSSMTMPPRIRRMTDMMQGVARQASLDPGDDLGL